MKFKRTLENFLTGVGMAAAAFSFAPSKAKANDVTTITQVSSATAIDSDGDGLTNNFETNTSLTNPNKSDTDGDGFPDGVEYGAFPIGNPLNDGDPSFGRILYNPFSIEKITTGTTTNAISPLWFPGNRFAYPEFDSNINNGGIFIKNIKYPSIARRELVPSGTLNPNTQLRQLTSTPLGLLVYYENNGKIFSANRANGNIVQAIPTLAQPALGYDLRNPAMIGKNLILDAQGNPQVDGDLWIVAETSLNDLRAYKLNLLRRWDGETSRTLTNFSSGTIKFTKVSRNGENLMFIVDSNNKSELRVYKGLQDLLAGTTGPYTGAFDNRGEALTFFSNGVALSGGFDDEGAFAYWCQDRSNVYRLNSPLNFDGADFDTVFASIGIKGSGGFGLISPGKVVIPLPGNQITPNAIRGTVLLADDYLSDGTPGGNFNIYAMNFDSATRARNGANVDVLNGLFDINGVKYEGNIGDHEFDFSDVAVNFPGYTGNTTGTLTNNNVYRPLSQSSSRGVAKVSRFGPTGLKFKFASGADHSTTPSLTQRVDWTVANLITNVEDDGTATVIDNNLIAPVQYNDSISDFEALPSQQIISLDRNNKNMKFRLLHLSDYAIGGQTSTKYLSPFGDSVNAADSSWTLYE